MDSLDDLVAALENDQSTVLAPKRSGCAEGTTVFESPLPTTADVARLVAAAGKSGLITRLCISREDAPQRQQRAQVKLRVQGRGLTLDLAEPLVAVGLVGHALGRNTSIQELATSGFGLDETAAAALASGLAGNTTLQTLSLDLDFPMSDEATARIASALARNSALHVLTMAVAVGTGDGMSALSLAIGQHRGLKGLNLRHEPLTAQACHAFGAALASSPCLERLTFRDSSFPTADAAAVFDGLARNSSLTRLCFQRGEFGEEATAALGNALAQHPRLRVFSMSSCALHDNKRAALAQGLASCASLDTLELLNVGLSADEATALAPALRSNANLTELDLTRNAIGDAGATAIGMALEHNATLRRLILLDNRIGAAGARAIGGALAVNRSVRVLDLDDNNIYLAGFQDLCKALSRNQGLSSFDAGVELQWGSSRYEALEAVLGLVSCNTGLSRVSCGRTNPYIRDAMEINQFFFRSGKRGGGFMLVHQLRDTLASLWVVLTAATKRPSSSGPTSPVPHPLMNDLIFSLARMLS